MAHDGHGPAEFYATVQGAVVARLLRARLALLWPDLSRQTLLGLGYTTPYLRQWREQATCLAVNPPQTEVTRWPPGAPGLICVAEDAALPFPDLHFDRVLMVHGIEATDSARKLLREVWRVLRDDGRLLIVAPNRRGWWAHVDSTPFGSGRPYSPGQIGRLLGASLFRVERRDTALFLPPSPSRLVLRGAGMWEGAGRRLVPKLAGVTLTEATKDVFSALPLTAQPGVAVRRGLVMG